MRSLLVPALLAVSAADAAAHVAPSETENNRYAKIVLFPDELRISYTVFFGHRPGAVERRMMDKDRDGVVSDAEARDFSKRLLAEIAPLITVELDGAPARAAWKVADLGLGTPTTEGGAFALDLVLTAPLADPAAETHDLWVEDRWNPPLPGETEVRIDESPGVHVVRAHARRDGRGAQRSFAFRGAATTPGERGIYVAFRVDAEARARAPRGPGRSHVKVALVVAGAAVVVTAVALALILGRRRATGG